jgi:hypothetical protein
MYGAPEAAASEAKRTVFGSIAVTRPFFHLLNVSQAAVLA